MAQALSGNLQALHLRSKTVSLNYPDHREDTERTNWSVYAEFATRALEQSSVVQTTSPAMEASWRRDPLACSLSGVGSIVCLYWHHRQKYKANQRKRDRGLGHNNGGIVTRNEWRSLFGTGLGTTVSSTW